VRTKFSVDSSAVFILERGQTHTHRDTQNHRCHWSPYPRSGYNSSVIESGTNIERERRQEPATEWKCYWELVAQLLSIERCAVNAGVSRPLYCVIAVVYRQQWFHHGRRKWASIRNWGNTNAWTPLVRFVVNLFKDIESLSTTDIKASKPRQRPRQKQRANTMNSGYETSYDRDVIDSKATRARLLQRDRATRMQCQLQSCQLLHNWCTKNRSWKAWSIGARQLRLRKSN